MANSKRKCKYCKKSTRDYIVVNMSAYCNFDEAVKYASENKSKGKKIVERNNKNAVLELNKQSLKWQHGKTQPVFNKLRRAQEFKWFSDRGLEPVCISCQKPLGNDQWCNGHFKSVGSSGRLRYDFKNSYLQHNHNCNMHLSGDAKNMESGIIARFGEKEGRDIISYCEENNKPIKRTWQDLEALRKQFNKQLKDLV